MWVTAALALAGCGEQPGTGPDGRARPGNAERSELARELKTPAELRAMRRAFDGAPPVIPHDEFGAACTTCHDAQGVALEGVGFAPPSPHELTSGMSAMSRCQQCHVRRRTDELFVASTFEGLPQDLRKGARAHEFAPPVMPHPAQMRENCLACHSGPAARESLRCDHPDRARCSQCHVPARAGDEFSRP